jgi:hypothetical protein
MTLKECDVLEQREAAEAVTTPRETNRTVKVNISFEQAMKAQRWSRSIALLFL